MYRHCLTVFFVSSILPFIGYAETLETIRRQFEIYQRLSGEIEILSTDNAKEIDKVLQRTESKRLAGRQALDKAQTERQAPPHLPSTPHLPSPLFAEEYSAVLMHYVAVERAVARRALEQGKPGDAIDALRYVYHLAEELSDTGSLELRAAAARIRLQMLETAQALVLHTQTKQEHIESLYKIFEEQINRRTTDAIIWTRHREAGKQFFTDLAKRRLDTMVSPSLLKELTDRNALNAYRQETREWVNRDQLIFLQLSESVIESCSVPFFKRQPMLRALENELQKHRESATEPVFTLLLLRDVAHSMRLLAQERAGIETAYLALSVSLGKQHHAPFLNFLTGKDYEIRLITDGVMCTYEGNVKPFYVPYR